MRLAESRRAMWLWGLGLWLVVGGAVGQCPSTVLDPCTCSSTIYEPVSIVCDGAASLAQALTSVGPASVPIDSLTISNTPIPRLPRFAFQGFTVKRLVLRQNGLQAIDPSAFQGQLLNSLTELEIRDNALGQIPVTGVTALRALTTLVLAKNGIRSVGPGTFQPYASRARLRKLDLSANRIGSLHSDAFVGLVSLQEMGMDKNFLSAIPYQALQKIPSLEGLSLGVNKLTSVPSGALVFPNLKSLSLEVNKITNLTGEAFQGVPNLLYLYLSDNKLSSLPGSVFRFVRRLKVLAAGNNALGKVAGDTFAFVPGLVRVEMSECGIREIAPGTFQTLPQLQVLVLNKNLLTAVPRNMFQGLGELVSLDLKGNRVGVVEDGAFSALPALKHLDVSANALQTLYPDTFRGSLRASDPPTTRVLYVYENPWTCDQRLDWFRQWLRDNRDVMIDAPGYSHTLCAQPWWKRSLALKAPDPPTPPNATDSTNSLRGTTEAAVKAPQSGSGAGGGTKAAGTLGGANLAAVILGVILGVLILSVLLLMVVRYFIGKNRRERKEEERWMRDGSSSLSAPYASPSPPPLHHRPHSPHSPHSHPSSHPHSPHSPPPGQGFRQHSPPGQGYFLNRPWYWWF